jgi:hypothetical protein
MVDQQTRMAEQKEKKKKQKRKRMNTQIAADSAAKSATKSATETVRDHIDAPILKTVAGLSLLGFKTHFSCCGFDYKGQSENKSHMMGQPYVFLDYQQLTDVDIESNRLKCYLSDIAINSGWQFKSVMGCYINLYSVDDRPDCHPWKKVSSVHFYEAPLMAIQRLNHCLKYFEPLMKQDSVVIVDGNRFQKSKSSYWQYEPAADWTVTKEEWLAIPN